jgi:hypothetical protein
MMIDFEAIQKKEKTLAEVTAGMTRDDLRRLTNEMIDDMLALIADCDDADVVFVPHDPEAHDPYADDASDEDLAWTLGHVIVHATASSEEAAFQAAEMARGLTPEGRSRYEVPWETVTTIAQCRHRLEESRRMRLATLDVWPDNPHYEVTLAYRWVEGGVDARARFAMGLWHDYGHLGQIEEIARQAHAARVAAD